MLSTPFKKQDASREIAPLLFRLPTLLSTLKSPEALAHVGSGTFKTQGNSILHWAAKISRLVKKGSRNFTLGV